MINNLSEDNDVSPIEKEEKEDPAKKVDKLLKEGAKYRKQFEKGWKEAEDFYNGNQWPIQEPRPTKNFVFTIVEAEVPVLTDSLPSTDVIAYEEEKQDDAKILESCIHYTYEANHLFLKLTQGVRASLVTGTGWLYTDFDPDLENGQGLGIIKNIPWRSVFVDPSATEIDEADYVLINIPANLEHTKRRFPEVADQIKSQKLDKEMTDDPTNTLGSFYEKRWTNGSFGEESVSRYLSDNMCLINECWLKDYSQEPIPQDETAQMILEETQQFEKGENPDVGKFEDHEAHIQAHLQHKMKLASEAAGVPPEMLGQDAMDALSQDPTYSLLFALMDDHIEMHKVFQKDNPQGLKPKYKNNMRLIMKTGSTILYDGDSPVDDGLYPLVPIYCYKHENSIYGIGEVKNIIPVQKSFNEMDWMELQGLRLNANSGWVVDEESGVDQNTLTNEQGIVVKKKAGTEVQRLSPGQVSPQFEARKNYDRQAIEIISGINEASQGRRPTGVTAARAIEALQQQSIGRIRLKTNTLAQYSMLRLGWLTASRILKYWSSERQLRIYDKNGQIKRIDFDPERLQELKYDVKMAPGSVAGLDKESIFAVAKELFLAQAIDAKTLVEMTDLPYKNHILENIAARDQMRQQLEQATLQNEELKAQVQVHQSLDQEAGHPQANPPSSQHVPVQTPIQ